MNRLFVILLIVATFLINVPPAASDMAVYSYSADGTGVFSNSGTGTDNKITYTNDYYGNTLYMDIYTHGYSAWGDGNPYSHDQLFRVYDIMGTPYYIHEDAYYYAQGSYMGREIVYGDYVVGGVGGGTTCPTCISGGVTMVISSVQTTCYTASGNCSCIDDISLYIRNSDTSYSYIAIEDAPSYTFPIIEGVAYRLVFSDGAYHDFTCTGNEAFDYDGCTFVYGYTCGVDLIKLYKDDGGWVLTDTESQGISWTEYEMPITDGGDYLISFLDGGTVCHNETFSCTGNHVLIDFDRCTWVWPPSPWGPPIIIHLYAGHDYNIVVFKDEHGNFIENSQLAIYDTTDDQYIQRWADASEGYTLLGARFDTDHEVKLMLRTFDGVFTLDADHPANGTALIGEENIVTTNWTIPIKYNLNVLPIDAYGVPLFDVFCGLSEYTPLNPGSFWGMDLSDQGYVAVTNCSGFSMCDIVAEKEGYTDYRIEALNWTSKSAMVKDYRHNVVMEEE